MSARPRIGELLIHAGLLTREQLEQALEQQRTQGAGGRRLGQLLLDMGFVSEVQLTKVLSQQLSVPWVSLHHIDFSRQLLNLVPREIAEEHCLIPVYVRHERKVGDTLYLAMEDPTHDDAVRSVMAAAGMPVKSMIAAPSDIRAAIRAFYGADRPSSTQLAGTDNDRITTASVKPRALQAPGTTIARGAPEPAPAASTPAPAPPRDLPAVHRREAITLPERRVPSGNPDAPRAAGSEDMVFAPTMPEGVSIASSATAGAAATAGAKASTGGAPGGSAEAATAGAARAEPTAAAVAAAAQSAAPPKRPSKMISLTLLDGTTIKIPTQQRRRAGEALPAEEPSAERASSEGQLTTRDLIAALRIAAEGGGSADGTVGGYRWEQIVAALLSVLMRKQLITDWEFVEELNKRA